MTAHLAGGLVCRLVLTLPIPCIVEKPYWSGCWKPCHVSHNLQIKGRGVEQCVNSVLWNSCGVDSCMWFHTAFSILCLVLLMSIPFPRVPLQDSLSLGSQWTPYTTCRPEGITGLSCAEDSLLACSGMISCLRHLTWDCFFRVSVCDFIVYKSALVCTRINITYV